MAKTIVVVDDDEPLVYMLKENLEAEGYGVHTGHDGQSVMRLVSEKKPDLILMDFNMPGWNGLQALGNLRANPATAAIPVIFLTGEAAEKILPGGGDAKTRCFSKPIELDLLNATIKTLIKS
jgi:two-component system phosphate regulon response regulator PhoB